MEETEAKKAHCVLELLCSFTLLIIVLVLIIEALLLLVVSSWALLWVGQLRQRGRQLLARQGGLEPLARIYSCDLLTQEWADKSLLTSMEASPLAICKRETAAIRAEQPQSPSSRSLFKGRWIWCEVLMENVLFLPGSWKALCNKLLIFGGL